MVERKEILKASHADSPDKGSSRWKQVAKYGIIGGVGLALVLAVL